MVLGAVDESVLQAAVNSFFVRERKVSLGDQSKPWKVRDKFHDVWGKPDGPHIVLRNRNRYGSKEIVLCNGLSYQ